MGCRCSTRTNSEHEPCATSCRRPMASSTWLGSSEPDVHALPDDADARCVEKSSRLALDAPPSKLTHVAGAIHGIAVERHCAGSWTGRRSGGRAGRRPFFAFSSRCAQAFRAPRPAMMAGIFSVPARLPRRLPAPPSMSSSRREKTP